MALFNQYEKTAIEGVLDPGYKNDLFHDLDGPFKVLKTTRGVLFDLKRRFCDSKVFNCEADPLSETPRGANLSGMTIRICRQQGLDYSDIILALTDAYTDLFAVDRGERTMSDMELGLADMGIDAVMEVIERAIKISKETQGFEKEFDEQIEEQKVEV